MNFQELSKSNSTSQHSTIVFPLADAYRILRDVIFRHDVTIRVDLDLSSNAHMVRDSCIRYLLSFCFYTHAHSFIAVVSP